VIDVAPLDGAELGWEALARALRRARLVPVAAAGVGSDEAERAVAAGFGLLQLGSRLRSVAGHEAPTRAATQSSPPVEPAAPVEPAVAVEPSPPSARGGATVTVTHPVRGGQVVYARGADLVVAASVNPGAQVIADGSVHVWGPLRGRALAGASGKTDARIFCLELEAELVSVNGEYVMADELPESLRGRPAQVLLEGTQVRIRAL
jgi:septum site-determining protein MinC